MPNKFLFADEAGDFTFKRQNGASKYFMLCTFATDDCALSHDLLQVRRELVLSGQTDRDKLHATSDLQETRNKVFTLLASHDFRVDVTILEKAKASPQIRLDEASFYRYIWRFHFANIAGNLMADCDKLLITAASIGSKKTKASFKLAVNNTIQQTVERDKWEVSFTDSSKDPLLWAADYCAWAIQRKWEIGDARSYDLISDKIFTEIDLLKSEEDYFY